VYRLAFDPPFRFDMFLDSCFFIYAGYCIPYSPLLPLLLSLSPYHSTSIYPHNYLSLAFPTEGLDFLLSLSNFSSLYMFISIDSLWRSSFLIFIYCLYLFIPHRFSTKNNHNLRTPLIISYFLLLYQMFVLYTIGVFGRDFVSKEWRREYRKRRSVCQIGGGKMLVGIYRNKNTSQPITRPIPTIVIAIVISASSPSRPLIPLRCGE
jgi:hypothetical protein